MVMTSLNISLLNISLPGALKAYIEEQVASGDWGTATEYVRDLIRQDKERRLGNVERARSQHPPDDEPRMGITRRVKRTRRRARMVKSGKTVME
jgi:antitoxin ParD1/3/4